MPIAEQKVLPLYPGQMLSRADFLRRWDAMPQLKRAELIGGIVFMPSPLALDHGDTDGVVVTWLGNYAAATPICRPSINATWFMRGDAPQPDNSLRILPEYGGKTRTRVWRGKRYGSGGPEFLAETCVSSYDYDLHEKLDLYERAQVNEYLAVLVGPHEVWWHRLVKGTLQGVSPSKDGIYRSLVFPGLWLNPDALLACDHAKVLATLQQGLRSAEHAKFVAALAKKKSK